MATKIEWATETWNPITGCTAVSEGCANCYAKRMATRLRGRFGYPQDEPFKVTWQGDNESWHDGTLLIDRPLHWKKPRKIFVNSMSDTFHPGVWGTHQLQIWNRFLEADWHTYMVLTKRAGRMAAFRQGRPASPNVWLGVSVELQKYMGRVAELLKIPAAVRFVSLEPLLGPVTILSRLAKLCGPCGKQHLEKTIHWVIVGCESGPGRRPCKLEWIADIVDQCKAAGVPCFVKQIPLPKQIHGAWTYDLTDLDDLNQRFGSRVSKDPTEWPEELRCRQWPNEKT